MEKKTVKENYLLNMLYQVLTIITPIITAPYISRHLGANAIGTVSYVASVVLYFTLASNMGLSSHGQLEVAYNQNDKEKTSQVFWEIIAFRFILTIIIGIFYFIMFCINNELSVLFKIYLINFFSCCFDITWYFNGLENFSKMVYRNIFIKLVCVVLTFVIIKTPADMTKYALLHVGTDFISIGLLFIGIRKYICLPKHKLNLTRHIKPSIILFIPQIANTIYLVLDKTMLGKMLTTMDEVGYYEQGERIVKILMTVITTVGTVMSPRIASCLANKEEDKINLYMKRTFNYIFMAATPMIFGLIAVAHNFCPLFFGPGYERVPMIMIYLSPLIMIISIYMLTGSYLIPAKKMKPYYISVFSGAIINFILNLFLIPKLMAYGAAIATLTSEFFVAFIQTYSLRKTFEIKEIFKGLYKYIIYGIIMFIGCILVRNVFNSLLYNLILQVIMGIIVYLILLVVFKDETFEYMKNVISNFIKKKFKKA